jgi:hypothetical protein
MRVLEPDEETMLRWMQSGDGRDLYNLIDTWITGVSFWGNRTSDQVTIVFQVDDPNRPDPHIVERLNRVRSLLIQAVYLLYGARALGF